MKKKVIIIPASDHPRIRVEEISDDLQTLRDLVGGHIEAVSHPKFTGIINEEGKLEGLNYNPLATFLVSSRLGSEDYIAGTCVLFGPVDSEGELTDVDPILWQAFGGS